MCLCNKLMDMNKSSSPRSPYRRQRRELLKPRLSRKIAPSAKINLNNFWEKFEEASKETSMLVSFNSPTTAEILRDASCSTFQDNEINENLCNELLELGKL